MKADLTDRQLILLQALAEGMSNAEIAAELQISADTVKFALGRVYAKLHVHSRAAAVAAGYRAGLLGGAR